MFYVFTFFRKRCIVFFIFERRYTPMGQTSKEEQKALQRQQEAQSFIGKKGPNYVLSFATKEEKGYFEGKIYHHGIPDLDFIFSIASPVIFY